MKSLGSGEPDDEIFKAATDTATPRDLTLRPTSPLETAKGPEIEPETPSEPAPLQDPLSGATPSSEDLARIWTRLRGAIRKRLKREQYETWFTRTVLVNLEPGRIVLAVHNNFTRDWLNNYYREVIDQAIEEVLSARPKLEFLVDPERTANLISSQSADSFPQNSGSTQGSAHGLPQGQPPGENPALDSLRARGRHPGNAQPPLRPGPSRGMSPAPGTHNGLLISSDVVLNPNYRFGGYVVGPCNRFAHAACVGVSEKPGNLYNPLFLHGNVGLGKTHLLQSLCHTLLERDPGTRILFLSCETFVNHFIAALEDGDLQAFRNKYRNVDLLVVDDIHILANKERTQEEFFHTFNTLYNAGKQIVLSSDSPPLDIPTLQDRLVSRFKWGLVTEVETPCYETRMAILKRKSRDRGRELPDDVASFLAERIDTNIRELEGAVTKVLGYASLSGRPIDLTLLRECLGELFTVKRGEPSIEDIMGLVTKEFGIKLAEIQSRRRTAAIAFPRQIGMYLARRITRMSLEEIGGYFGGRDHSTVLYGVQKIDKRSKEDPAVQDLLSRLLLELRDDRRDLNF